ncbi:MAG: EF-P beta-lysylation protein EpmB [Aureliella sp.]
MSAADSNSRFKIMAQILARNALPVEATSVQGGSSQSGDVPATWQTAMKRALRTAGDLCQYVGVEPDRLGIEAEKQFPVFVPLQFAEKIEKGNPRDPLLIQVLATGLELAPGGATDAVGDREAQFAPGVLQKYSGRCLVISTGACAIHCRYCFRRHFPYDEAPKGGQGLMQALDAVAADPSIEEVILSGGDPLTLADGVLARFTNAANDIEHLRRIRFHTRVPGVIPSRVCDSLLDWIASSRIPMFFVTHFNHANEICTEVATAMQRLQQTGVTLLNQAVLLQGVNDSFQTQLELCKRLLDVRVIPYYLHQLDRVQGTLHFEAPEASGQEIIRRLRSHLPGYGVPTFVQEIPGQPSKTPL